MKYLFGFFILLYLFLCILTIWFAIYITKNWIQDRMINLRNEFLKSKPIGTILLFMLVLVPFMFYFDCYQTAIPDGNYTITISLSPSSDPEKTYLLPADIHVVNDSEIVEDKGDNRDGILIHTQSYYISRVHWPNGGYSEFDAQIYSGEINEIRSFDGTNYTVSAPYFSADILEVSPIDRIKSIGLLTKIFYFLTAISTIIGNLFLIASYRKVYKSPHKIK